MNLTNWLTSPVAEALGWTLIHALWQGFAVVLTIAFFLHLTRGGRAALRYRIGISGLLMQVLASAATFGWYYEPRSLANTAAVFQPNLNVPITLAAPAHGSWLVSSQAFLTAHLAQIVWLWLVGVGVFAVRLVGGWVYIHRLRTTATLPVPTVLSDAITRITRKMNVSVTLHLTTRVAGPLVVGVLKPVVLWPMGLLAGLSTADVEAILAHELAHVRRHDYLINVLQSVVEVLYFFHPALWWLSARVREEREHCCDDLAVALTGDARVVARALARVEEWQRNTAEAPALAMAFASKRQLLLQRVRRMLGVPTRPLVSNGSLIGLTLITMLLVSVSLYAAQRTEVATPKRQIAPPIKRLTYRNHPSRRNTLTSSNYGLNTLTTGAYAPVVANVEPVIFADPQTPLIYDLDSVPAPAGDTAQFRSVQRKLEALTREIQAIMAERQPMIEKLNKEMATLRAQEGTYQKQLAPIVRQANQLARQQQTLVAKLTPISRELQRLSGQNTTKAKALVRQKEIQAEQLEKQINGLDAQIEQLNSRMEQLEPYQRRMEAISDSIDRLHEPMNALAEKMNGLSEQIAEEAERETAEGHRRAQETVRGRYNRVDGELVPARPARAPRPPRPPRPAVAPAPPRPDVPPQPDVPAPPAPTVAPTPAVAPHAMPVPALAPVATPAPARAPKSRKTSRQ